MEIKELKTIHNLVKNILEEHPQARNSDNILYYHVIKHIGAQKGINIDSMSLPIFLLNMKAYHLPSIETVGRARRKIVEQYPDLAGDKKVEDARRDNEDTFRHYARSYY